MVMIILLTATPPGEASLVRKAEHDDDEFKYAEEGADTEEDGLVREDVLLEQLQQEPHATGPVHFTRIFIIRVAPAWRGFHWTLFDCSSVFTHLWFVAARVWGELKVVLPVFVALLHLLAVRPAAPEPHLHGVPLLSHSLVLAVLLHEVVDVTVFNVVVDDKAVELGEGVEGVELGEEGEAEEDGEDDEEGSVLVSDDDEAEDGNEDDRSTEANEDVGSRDEQVVGEGEGCDVIEFNKEGAEEHLHEGNESDDEDDETDDDLVALGFLLPGVESHRAGSLSLESHGKFL